MLFLSSVCGVVLSSAGSFHLELPKAAAPGSPPCVPDTDSREDVALRAASWLGKVTLHLYTLWGAAATKQDPYKLL